MSEVETVRKTLKKVRAERDHAFLLLRVLRYYGAVPEGPIRREVNDCVALESESDIEAAQREVERWVFEHMERSAGTEEA